MGAQESKPVTPTKQKEKSDQYDDNEIKKAPPTPPILTPIDPRSPSVNIARTPVEILKFQPSNDDQLDSSVANSPKTVLLDIDPRSPTVEFVRTPIVVAATTKSNNPAKLVNKNLDNVRNSAVITTPTRAVGSQKHVQPKLLESSPLTIDQSKVVKRKSFVGLLETNIDFTETDLDQAALERHSILFNKSQEEKSDEDEVEPVLKELAEVKDGKIADLLPLLVEAEIKSEDVEESIVEEPPLAKNDSIKECKSEIVDEKSINITAAFNELDKKLTHLIYEDESDDEILIKQRFTKLKENNRTPLAMRNGNENRVKTKLKVSDKPTKKTDLSKIPVFKDIRGKKGVQCENTPPRNMEERPKYKGKVTRWDADKTLII